MPPSPTSAPQQHGHLMTLPEVAAYLRIPLKTLYDMRYRGVGPVGIKVGRHVRLRREDLDAWLAEHRDVRSPNSAAG